MKIAAWQSIAYQKLQCMAETGHAWQIEQHLDAIRYDWRSDVVSGVSKKTTESVILHHHWSWAEHAKKCKSNVWN